MCYDVVTEFDIDMSDGNQKTESIETYDGFPLHLASQVKGAANASMVLPKLPFYIRVSRKRLVTYKEKL